MSSKNQKEIQKLMAPVALRLWRTRKPQLPHAAVKCYRSSDLLAFGLQAEHQSLGLCRVSHTSVQLYRIKYHLAIRVRSESQ